MVDEAGVSDGWIKEGVLCDKHRYCEYRYGDDCRRCWTVTVEECKLTGTVRNEMNYSMVPV